MYLPKPLAVIAAGSEGVATARVDLQNHALTKIAERLNPHSVGSSLKRINAQVLRVRPGNRSWTSHDPHQSSAPARTKG
jgi:hypothetical protein